MAKKILLADDSITIQKVIELTFSDEDFEVVTVGNGRLALEKLEDVRPDIVLCDIIMPEKDGYEVCQQIKSNPAFSGVPVLLLTGAFEPFDQEKATQVGSDGFLAKPFEPETLIAKVKDLMGRVGEPAGDTSPAAVEPVTVTPLDDAAPRPPSLADDRGTATTAPQRALSPSTAVPEPVPPVAEPGGSAAFTPEEPFAHFETEADADAPGGALDEGLAPVTPEESATLAGEPPVGAATGEDSASTVMFHAGDLPWTERKPPEPAAPADAGFAPSSAEAPDLAEEAGAAFEEVLEEDLEFGGSGLAPGAQTSPKDSVFTPGEPLTGAGVGEPEPPPMFEVATPVEPEPPVLEPEPVGPEPRPEADTPTAPTPSLETIPPFESGPPVVEAFPELPAVVEQPVAKAPRSETLPPLRPEPEAVTTEPPLAPLAGPEPFMVPEPTGTTGPDEASFADVQTAAEPEVEPVPTSEAASVPVPVEQVEKIAQRVVAQVSEKIVREIAWEVVPDLAEALIKQEIERLKAELEKL